MSHPLPPRFRSRLEAAFGANLAHVRVHGGRLGSRVAAQAGGLACALDGREVFLGPVPRGLRALVVAHEVAHLVQQRRGGVRAGRAAAEREADLAAIAAIGGRRAAMTLAIDPRDPACWGEAGHYYTVYFVALAAGVGDLLAYRLAFWTQMADEIDELNAVPAGIAMVTENATSYPSDLYADMVAGYANLERSILAEVFANSPYAQHVVPPPAIARYERSEAYFNWQNVQRGLHALTGRECEAETRRRVGITGSFDPRRGQEFEFGLSLHPLGDSFAHRDDSNGRMFAPPLGHGPHGHEPDVLGEHRRALYRRYVGTLHQVLSVAAGSTRGAPLSEAATVAALDTIIPIRRSLSDDQIRALSRRPGREGHDPLLSAMRANARASEPDEETQIAQIRALARSQIGQAMQPYTPETFDSGAFSSFRAPPGIAVPLAHVQRALVLAREWS
jgi:hypothetical protein